MSAHPNHLEVALVRKIRDDGPVSFRDFMATALYDPAHGYYALGRAAIDARGGYATTGGRHRLFGRLVARWAEARWEELGRRETFRVVEFGPGTGRFASDFLAAADTTAFGPSVRYVCVEPSAGMRERQRKLFTPPDPRLSWSNTEALADAPASGVVIANELVDALPVHRVRYLGETLEEQYVGVTDGALILEWSEPSTPALAEYLGRYMGPNAQRLEQIEIEVSLDAIEWLSSASSALHDGFLLTSDFGDVAERLFGPWRPSGSIRAFEDGQFDHAVLAHPGRRDLSSSVNFTALVEGGRAFGLEPLSFEPQRSFLMNLGLADDLAALATASVGRPESQFDLAAAKALLAPEGLSDTMRVLVQRKFA